MYITKRNFSGLYFVLKSFLEPTITAQYIPHGTAVNISWELSDSIYSNRNVMVVVAELSSVIFTSQLIDAGYRHRCITDLRPNTRYEIKVIVSLGCDNVSNELDVLTQSPISLSSFSTQNCIVLNLTSAGKHSYPNS